MYAVRLSVGTQGTGLFQLESEVEVYEGNTAIERIDNVNRQYTRVVLYKTSGLYYFLIVPSAFTAHISRFLGRVIDFYVRSCRRRERRMKPFGDAIGASKTLNDDAVSST